MSKKKPPVEWADKFARMRKRLQRKPAEMAKHYGLEETEYMKIEEGIRKPTKSELLSYQRLKKELDDPVWKRDRRQRGLKIFKWSMPVDIMGFNPEDHVKDSLHTALALANDKHVSVRHTLQGMLAESRKAKTEAFKHFHSLVRLPQFQTPKISRTSDSALKTVKFDQSLAAALSIAKPYLMEEGRLWGRDLITIVLLAIDPFLSRAAKESGKTLQELRENWWQFVTSSKIHRSLESWKQLWFAMGVPIPEERSQIQSDNNWLLIWDPKRFSYAEFYEAIWRVGEEGVAVYGWDVANSEVLKGDRVFLMRQGNDEPGLVGSGVVVSEGWEDKHWDKKKSESNTVYAKVRWDSLSRLPIISLDDLVPQTSESNLWVREGTSRTIPPKVAELLKIAWEKVHPSSAKEVTQLLAGYKADSVEEEKDKLSIGHVVRAFCSVMLSKQVHPPLSIGLFGDWGSGKSFFMGEMRRQVDISAEIARKTDSSHWHGHVAQIEFNAWHYSDANLWASFVTHIFDSLARIINPGPGLEQTRANLLKELETSKELQRQAEFELDDAEAALQESKDSLARQREDLQNKQQKLTDIRLRNIQAILKAGGDKKLQKQLKRLSEELGIDPTWKTVQELEDVVTQTKTLFGHIRALWFDFKQSLRSRLILALTLVVLVLPSIVGLVIYIVGQVRGEEYLSKIQAYMTVILGPILCVISGVARFLPKVLRKFRKFDNIRKKLTHSVEAHEKELLKPAQDEVENAQTRVRLAEDEFARTEKRLTDAEQAVRDASTGQRFYKFIEERSTSVDYRKHLGLISLVHRDFKNLAKLLEDCTTYRPKADTVGDEETEVKDNTVQKAETALKNQASGNSQIVSEGEVNQKNEPIQQIHRIILYIDDLDRCLHQQVVDVLQAVHLLLALPLFVVVVGVDSRWLLRALEVHYPEFLSMKRSRRSLNQSDRNDEDNEEEESATTPQNYLEKIFQIPFCIPEMGEKGFGDLVDYLTEDKKFETQHDTPESSETEFGEDESLESGNDTDINQDPFDSTQDNPPDPQSDPNRPTDQTDGTDSTPAEQVLQQSVEKRLPLPKAISIETDERVFMRTLHPLIRTPRATKRFVNVYRLLRAIYIKDEKPFLKSDYRVVLTLLALNVAYPYLANHIFRELNRRSNRSRWLTFIRSFAPRFTKEYWENDVCGRISEDEATDWKRITDCLSKLKRMPPSLKQYKSLASMITQFSFWPQDESV